MSANGPPADLVIPPGFTAPGMHGDAAPDSALAQLRRDVAAVREAKTVVLDWTLNASHLRATYGTLDVDEAGTTATAATAVVMPMSIQFGGTPIVVNVDHPFFCIIRDDRSGAVLFLGAISDVL